MQNLQFHPLAEIEADEASLYYEEISLPLSARFHKEITSGLDQITTFPEAYPVTSGGRVRKFIFSVFPYFLLYANLKNGIYIVAVAHHSRHPPTGNPA